MIMLMKNLLKLASMVPQTRRRLFFIVVLSILFGAVNAVWPYFIKWIVDNAPSLLANKTSSEVVIFVIEITVGLIIFGAVLSLIDWVNWLYANKTYNYVEAEIYKESYKKLQGLSLPYFESQPAGALQSKIIQGISSFTSWIMMTSQNLLEPLAVMAFATILIFINSPIIGFITILSEAIYVYDFVTTNKKSKPLYKIANKTSEKVNGRISESFSNFATIKTMSIENTVRQKLFGFINKGRVANDNINNVWAKSITRRLLLNRTVVFLSIGIMLYSLSIGKMTTGTILLVILYLQQIQSNLMFFSRYLTATAQNESRATRLVKFLETKPEFDDSPESVGLEQLSSIEFKKVTFDYKEGKKGAVKNISFKIDAGKTVALVGPSGVGKSTLTKLLLRFYEPSSGKIIINNKDVSHYTAESIRQHIGMVMQDVALFNATIMDNLQIANSKATERQIIAAAKQAHADEFIRQLPKGYKTMVGERGVKLSGGQKQRVAIARAILKNPQLIVLDEATSALDSQSEKLVQDGLEKLMNGRSALIIAHRLSTVMHADEILVLQKGTIVERGSHAKLIRYNGLYKKLFDMQSASGKVRL